MTAQPIKGLEDDIIPACNAQANHRLGKAMLSHHAKQSKHSLYTSLQKLRKDEEGEGRDFSGSLAQSYW